MEAHHPKSWNIRNHHDSLQKKLRTELDSTDTGHKITAFKTHRERKEGIKNMSERLLLVTIEKIEIGQDREDRPSLVHTLQPKSLQHLDLGRHWDGRWGAEGLRGWGAGGMTGQCSRGSLLASHSPPTWGTGETCWQTADRHRQKPQENLSNKGLARGGPSGHKAILIIPPLLQPNTKGKTAPHLECLCWEPGWKELGPMGWCHIKTLKKKKSVR